MFDDKLKRRLHGLLGKLIGKHAATIPPSVVGDSNINRAALGLSSIAGLCARVFVYTAARSTQPRDAVRDREPVPREINKTSGQSWVDVTHMLQLGEDDGHGTSKGSFTPLLDHQHLGHTPPKTVLERPLGIAMKSDRSSSNRKRTGTWQDKSVPTIESKKAQAKSWK